MGGKAETSGLDLAWGAMGIGNVIKRTPRQTHHMLSTGQLRRPAPRKSEGGGGPYPEAACSL